MRRKRVVKIPIFEDIRSCTGLHAARRKAMPDDTPVRRGCGMLKARENVTSNTPPKSGPSPNTSDTKKPDASSELQVKEKNDTILESSCFPQVRS
jgi:hypothetical protein